MSRSLSVTEYAHLTGKDPGNIRRMLITGRLEGTKIGNQWVIPSDAVYPEDRRIKNGNFVNWRKRQSRAETEAVIKRLTVMVEELKKIYGGTLREVMMYGSYARGTQTEDSDVDIALILKERPAEHMTDKMLECVAGSELETGKELSVVDIQESDYENWKTVLPFYSNLASEGIVLWREA